MHRSRLTTSLLVLVILAMSSLSFASEPPSGLNSSQASSFAKLALKGVGKEYPNKLDHVMNGTEDLKGPKALHPSFYGCYDWHSSVHGHWMLARLLRLFPELSEAQEIRGVLNEHFTTEALKAEADYFDRKESKSFERPYGWAWLLKLAEEVNDWTTPTPSAGPRTSRRLPTRL